MVSLQSNATLTKTHGESYPIFFSFEATVKSTASLISFSICLSFEYRRASDLFVIFSSSYRTEHFYEFLGSFLYKTMSSANEDTFPLPVCSTLISFRCLFKSLLWLRLQVLYSASRETVDIFSSIKLMLTVGFL